VGQESVDKCVGAGDADETFVLVEDDVETGRGLTLLLRTRFPTRRIELFVAGKPALEFCRSEKTTLLLCDLGLPDMHGLDVIRVLRSEGRVRHVIVITGSPTDELPRELWDLGVAGFIDKVSLDQHLQPAVERVLEGGMYFSAQITPARLGGQLSGGVPSGTELAALSPREREVARLVATGLLSKEVADQLQLSPRTVEKYRTRVMHKVGVRSVPQLVYWCLRRGLV